VTLGLPGNNQLGFGWQCPITRPAIAAARSKGIHPPRQTSHIGLEAIHIRLHSRQLPAQVARFERNEAILQSSQPGAHNLYVALQCFELSLVHVLSSGLNRSLPHCVDQNPKGHATHNSHADQQPS
jgi:hypothetical protein